MVAETAWKIINKNENDLSVRDTKYRRNFRVYYNSYRGEDIRNPISQPLGLYFSVDDQLDRPPPVINVAQSAVDTVVSTMSQVKVRPFFNPVNGTYKTRKVSRNAQIYFDEFFDKNNIYIDAPEALRMAMIFEVGYFWANEMEKCVKIVRPWEYYYSQSEYQFGKQTHYHLRFDHYPVSPLKKRLEANKDKPNVQMILDRLENDPLAVATYRIFYDLVEKERLEFLGNTLIGKEKIDFDCVSVAEIYFKKPIKGSFSSSLIDDIITIQTQINEICRKMSQAISLTPANLVFVPKGQGQIKTSMVQSDAGIVYEFVPIQGSPPIEFVTPAPLDPEYINLLSFFIEKAFNQPGVSEMQALSKKPGSLQSGSALETLDDIFSNRQNVILNAYIGLLTKVAKICLEVFPGSDEILPKSNKRSRITWAELRKEKDAFNIQISASSSLSRDPKTKLDQITNLVASGFLDKALAADYLEMPDLEDAYSIINSGTDYNRYIIDRAVETGKYDFFEVTDINQLFQLSVDELLRCASADEDSKVIERLKSLINVVSMVRKKMLEAQQQINQEQQMRQQQANAGAGAMAPQTAPNQQPAPGPAPQPQPNQPPGNVVPQAGVTQ